MSQPLNRQGSTESTTSNLAVRRAPSRAQKPPRPTPAKFRPELFDDVTMLEHGSFSKAVIKELYSRGCCEMEGLPRVDLRSSIHPLFARDKFANLGSDAEYEYIQPALNLASCFVTEESMLKFFSHVQHGKVMMRRTMRGSKLDNDFYYLADGPEEKDEKKALEQTRNKLVEMAQGLQIHMLGRKWNEDAGTCAGRAFRGPEQLEWYKDSAKSGYLLDQEYGEDEWAWLERDLKNCNCGCRLEKVEWDDDFSSSGDEGDKTKRTHRKSQEHMEAPLVNRRLASQEQVSKPRIALSHDFERHIRDAATEQKWSHGEELRFQFTLATTLVHEIVHAFYMYAQRRVGVWHEREPCFGLGFEGATYSIDCCTPRRRENHRTPHDLGMQENWFPAELGRCWEVFATGCMFSGVSMALRRCASKTEFNELRMTALQAKTFHESAGSVDKISSETVLPLEWVQRWFRESTWESIRAQGRIKGRPQLNKATLLVGSYRKDTFMATYTVDHKKAFADALDLTKFLARDDRD